MRNETTTDLSSPPKGGRRDDLRLARPLSRPAGRRGRDHVLPHLHRRGPCLANPEKARPTGRSQGGAGRGAGLSKIEEGATKAVVRMALLIMEAGKEQRRLLDETHPRLGR